MSRSSSHTSRITLTLLCLLLLSGQLSAYPLFCTMPGMEMHGMDSMGSQSSVAGEVLPHVSAELSADADEMSNCEQICGYCLSYSHPGTDVSNPISHVISSPQADRYSRHEPSEPPGNPFRPPITV